MGNRTLVQGRPWGLGVGGAPVVVPPNVQRPDGSIPGVAQVLELPLPELVPVPDATEFNPEGSKATAAIEANILIPNVTVAVPLGVKAVIRGVTFYVNNILASSQLSFSVLINGNAPAGYGNVVIFPRVAPFVGTSFESMIRFEGPATVTVVYTNADGGNYVVGAALSGWFWPQGSDQRWKRLGAN